MTLVACLYGLLWGSLAHGARSHRAVALNSVNRAWLAHQVGPKMRAGNPRVVVYNDKGDLKAAELCASDLSPALARNGDC